MTAHPSNQCPDFPGLRDDYRCRHNPPTGRIGTVPFLRVRACLDSLGEMWLETLKDGIWFPSASPDLWTMIGDDGEILTRGQYVSGVEGAQT